MGIAGDLPRPLCSERREGAREGTCSPAARALSSAPSACSATRSPMADESFSR